MSSNTLYINDLSLLFSSVHLSVWLSVCLSVCLSTCQVKKFGKGYKKIHNYFIHPYIFSKLGEQVLRGICNNDRKKNSAMGANYAPPSPFDVTYQNLFKSEFRKICNIFILIFMEEGSKIGVKIILTKASRIVLAFLKCF